MKARKPRQRRESEEGGGDKVKRPQVLVKEEPEDEAFVEKRGEKRRREEEREDAPSGSTSSPKGKRKKSKLKEELKEEQTGEDTSDDVKKERRGKKVKKEEEEEEKTVSSKKKKKKIKEENEDSQPLKLKKKIKAENEDSKPLKLKRKKNKSNTFVGDRKDPKREEIEERKALKREEIEERKALKREEIEERKALKLKKKEEEERQRWRWWEEEKYEDGVKWKFLEHKGPYFPPEYQPLPDDVHFYYNGKAVKLSPAAEEVALFFAQMLDHEYTTKAAFRSNFFKDWRKEMTHEERVLVQDLDLCDFGELHSMHRHRVDTRKNMSKEEKQVSKEANQKLVEEYGFCLLDHHRERIGNFKMEPPGLFRGRGEHPKQGQLKKRLQPEDVIINCSKESRIPEPPAGHRWKEVRHDNHVTWLASWTENVQGSVKYIMLNANSKLKGEKDWEKYEVARKLKGCVEDIRRNYMQELRSKLMGTRQRAVALYFIDKLALRAGNEKEEGETADTVGCCSLRVEHVTLHERLDAHDHVVEFDFLGKDCIRYYNKVPVIRKVFKNLKLFVEKKEPGDDLFDRLSTAILNKHLGSLMPGLTAKVFRTYNASITLQQQLKELSNMSDNQAEKLLSYNRANRAVAVLCNHQRAPPKSFDQSMANLAAKIDAKREKLVLDKKELKQAKKEAKANPGTSKLQSVVERRRRAVQSCEEQLLRLEVQATDREENKQIALGTSKLNYLDPRISVAWCKHTEVPLDKIYNASQRAKFAWAVDMTDKDFLF